LRQEAIDVVFAVLVVPQLGGDPELFALDSAAEDCLEGGADFGLIAVDRAQSKCR
jgi:hypothetical protein